MPDDRSISSQASPGAPSGRAVSAFSHALQELVSRFEDRPVQLGEILEATRGRGYHMLLLLIALPFVGPIPLPGVSIPFGFVAGVLGTRLALDRGPWLPRRLLRREVSARSLRRILHAVSKIMQGVEYFLRPRLGFVPNHAIFSRVAGLMIAISGGMLMLPFPLPFSNSLPAWTIIFLSAGALGRDGLFFFGGCASFLLSIAFFTFVALGGVEVYKVLGRWWGH